MSRKSLKLFTIGYEKSGFPAFLKALQEAGVETLIDVRDLPLSRRAGFSKRMLAASLSAEGIGYLHLKPLGTPKEGRIANKQHEWKKFWGIVDRQLATVEATLAFEHVAKVAKGSRCALMCFEADHSTCHRLRVAEVMNERFGFAVEHLSVPPWTPPS